MRAAIYCRISKDPKGLELGVTRQREDCEKLCADRGWELVAEPYVDNDTSAYSGTARPQYQALLDAVRAGEVDAVVAWHPDRLHRSPRELEAFIVLVEERRIAVATVRSGDYDLTTASGRMTARVVGAVARNESEQKSERIRRALEQNARNGKKPGGRRPFGFEDDGVTHRPNEADAIRDAAIRVLAGMTWHAIVRDWNARGITPPQGAATWSPTNWRRMMTSPRLAGLRAFNGEVIGEAEWEAILDRATWEQAAARLAPKKRAGRPATHLLTGILRCGRDGCGKPLWFHNRGGRPAYKCYKREGHDGCGLTVTAPPLEDFVREGVIRLLAGDGLREARRRLAGHDKAQARATADLAAAEAQRDQLAVDFGKGMIERREWLLAREPLEQRIAEATRVLHRDRASRALAGLPTDEDDLRAAWEANDVDWRRAVIRAVASTILVMPATKPSPKFDTGRVRPEWVQ